MSTPPPLASDAVRLDLQLARQRQRPVTDFGTLMRRGMRQGVSAVQAHTGAGYMLPGGALLSAAISQAGSLADQLPAPAAAVGPQLSGGSAGAGGGGALERGGEAHDLMGATERMQAQNQRFSLQFMALQQRAHTEGQQHSAISNIMKKRDQTLTTIIQNVR